MTDDKPLVQEIMNDALSDPNLTNEERIMIDEIHLNAIYRARRIADSREDMNLYTRTLKMELEKSEGEIQRIRGMAANRESRRVENF